MRATVGMKLPFSRSESRVVKKNIAIGCIFKKTPDISPLIQNSYEFCQPKPIVVMKKSHARFLYLYRNQPIISVSDPDNNSCNAYCIYISLSQKRTRFFILLMSACCHLGIRYLFANGGVFSFFIDLRY